MSRWLGGYLSRAFETESMCEGDYFCSGREASLIPTNAAQLKQGASLDIFSPNFTHKSFLGYYI